MAYPGGQSPPRAAIPLVAPSPAIGDDVPPPVEPLVRTDPSVLKAEVEREKEGMGPTLGKRVVYDFDVLVSQHAAGKAGNGSSRSSPSFYEPKSKRDTTLLFESRFESGNLQRAIQLSENEYELLIRPDLKTQTNMQWFYFSVSNTRAKCRYTFKFINLYKTKSTFALGMRPLMLSSKERETKGIGWRRWGENVCYYASSKFKLRRRGRDKYCGVLSFDMEFPHSFDTCYIAMCYPYTYSDLMSDIDSLVSSTGRRKHIVRSSLCKTLAGNDVPVLTISHNAANFAFAPADPDTTGKLTFVITARVHPGETNASWMMRGLLKYLTDDDNEEATALRKRATFKIVPMLNPDGVINGNYRCSLAGYDLNRCWLAPKADVHPTIYYTKKMCASINKSSNLVCYIDMHGHSKKLNIFTYGCTNPSKVERLFPRMLYEDGTNFFSWSDCTFSVSHSKRSTARVVLWRELGLANSFTLEASFGGAGFGRHQSLHFSERDFERMGALVGRCCSRYLEPGQHAKYIEQIIDLRDDGLGGDSGSDSDDPGDSGASTSAAQGGDSANSAGPSSRRRGSTRDGKPSLRRSGSGLTRKGSSRRLSSLSSPGGGGSGSVGHSSRLSIRVPSSLAHSTGSSAQTAQDIFRALGEALGNVSLRSQPQASPATRGGHRSGTPTGKGSTTGAAPRARGARRRSVSTAVAAAQQPLTMSSRSPLVPPTTALERTTAGALEADDGNDGSLAASVQGADPDPADLSSDLLSPSDLYSPPFGTRFFGYASQTGARTENSSPHFRAELLTTASRHKSKARGGDFPSAAVPAARAAPPAALPQRPSFMPARLRRGAPRPEASASGGGDLSTLLTQTRIGTDTNSGGRPSSLLMSPHSLGSFFAMSSTPPVVPERPASPPTAPSTGLPPSAEAQLIGLRGLRSGHTSLLSLSDSQGTALRSKTGSNKSGFILHPEGVSSAIDMVARYDSPVDRDVLARDRKTSSSLNAGRGRDHRPRNAGGGTTSSSRAGLIIRSAGAGIPSPRRRSGGRGGGLPKSPLMPSRARARQHVKLFSKQLRSGPKGDIVIRGSAGATAGLDMPTPLMYDKFRGTSSRTSTGPSSGTHVDAGPHRLARGGHPGQPLRFLLGSSPYGSPKPPRPRRDIGTSSSRPWRPPSIPRPGSPPSISRSHTGSATSQDNPTDFYHSYSVHYAPPSPSDGKRRNSRGYSSPSRARRSRFRRSSSASRRRLKTGGNGVEAAAAAAAGAARKERARKPQFAQSSRGERRRRSRPRGGAPESTSAILDSLVSRRWSPSVEIARGAQLKR